MLLRCCICAATRLVHFLCMTLYRLLRRENVRSPRSSRCCWSGRVLVTAIARIKISIAIAVKCHSLHLSDHCSGVVGLLKKVIKKCKQFFSIVSILFYLFIRPTFQRDFAKFFFNCSDTVP